MRKTDLLKIWAGEYKLGIGRDYSLGKNTSNLETMSENSPVSSTNTITNGTPVGKLVYDKENKTINLETENYQR
ncbi:MAG: hypothetical protein ACP5NV_04810 [Candidatus Woesearchaeota archaeon]